MNKQFYQRLVRELRGKADTYQFEINLPVKRALCDTADAIEAALEGEPSLESRVPDGRCECGQQFRQPNPLTGDLTCMTCGNVI